MPADTIYSSINGLIRWLDWYPLAVVVLLGLLGLYRTAWERRPLPLLNLATAGLGLLWLLFSGYELFMAWYSQVEFEQIIYIDTQTGNHVPPPYWPVVLLGNIPLLATQLLWWPRLRRNFGFSLGLALALLFEPILERLLILLLSQHRDYLPSSWVIISPDAPLRLALCFGGLGLLLGLRWWRRRA